MCFLLCRFNSLVYKSANYRFASSCETKIYCLLKVDRFPSDISLPGMVLYQVIDTFFVTLAAKS